MRAGRGFLILAILLIPAASAQAPMPTGHVLYCTKECAPADVNDEDVTNTPVQYVLYFHPRDILQRAPMNVIPPIPGREHDVNQGYLTPTVKLRDGIIYFDNNWFHAYHTPGPVDPETDPMSQMGAFAYPLRLGEGSAKLYWYLSPHAVPYGNSSSGPTGSVGAMAQVGISVRVETGPHPFHGTLVAEGSSSAMVLLSRPDVDYAYQFEVPLRIVAREIPAGTGLLVSINWFQYSDGGQQVAQSDWRVRTGPRFVPRLILPIEEPIRVLGSQSAVRDGVHYIGVEVAGVVGAYDLDPFTFNLTYKAGPTVVGAPTPLFYLFNPQRPLSVKILWALPSEGPSLRAGTYAFELSVSNLARTYEFRENVTFDILSFTKDKGASTPGLGFAGILAALVGAGLAAVHGPRRP